MDDEVEEYLLIMGDHVTKIHQRKNNLVGKFSQKKDSDGIVKKLLESNAKNNFKILQVDLKSLPTNLHSISLAVANKSELQRNRSKKLEPHYLPSSSEDWRPMYATSEPQNIASKKPESASVYVFV